MPSQRFTVFDVLEARGEFRKNPANAGAQTEQGEILYTGPHEFPKMVYHPLGEERIVVPGEVITTPLGPKVIGEQRELIHKIVYNSSQEEEALKAGWHGHPSESIEASGKEPPPTGQEQTVAQLKAEIERLQKMQAKLEASNKPKEVVNPLSKA